MTDKKTLTTICRLLDEMRMGIARLELRAKGHQHPMVAPDPEVKKMVRDLKTQDMAEDLKHAKTEKEVSYWVRQRVSEGYDKRDIGKKLEETFSTPEAEKLYISGVEELKNV